MQVDKAKNVCIEITYITSSELWLPINDDDYVLNYRN